MDNLTKLTDLVVKFRDERDWKKFHNPKDLTIAMSIEVNKLLEHFRYKDLNEVRAYMETNKQDVADELVDVLYHLLLIAHDEKIDLLESLESKLIKTGEKYPVELAKGKNLKYTAYEN